MNAFISGPTAGGPGTNNAAISTEFWDIVCPPTMRLVISSQDSPSDTEGKVIVDWWVERLKTVQNDCVEIDSKEKAIFDREWVPVSPVQIPIPSYSYSFFDSSRILSLWPELARSPIITEYLWSPLVYSILLRNFPILQPESIPALYEFSANNTLTGLVAIHLRRGDFRRHCPRLAGWRAQYNGLNQLPELPDKFDSSLYTYESDEYNDYYAEHCLPTVEQLVSRLSEIRKENRGLKRIYVLTNAWGFWLNGLKEALLKDGWENFRSTLDLSLDPKQTQVAAAVDMTIAERSHVFIGNGVRSSHRSYYTTSEMIFSVFKLDFEYNNASTSARTWSIIKSFLVIINSTIP